MPAPETIGLTLAPDRAAQVASVAPGTVAEAAGFRAGDTIAFLGGQPLISVADFAWALHRAPPSGVVRAVIQREDLVIPVTIDLPAGWRTKADISRRVGTWSMRAMALGGMTLLDLDAATRQGRGLAGESMALLVKAMGQYNKHGTAKKVGFLKDDVIVAIDGFAGRASEGELIGRLLRSRKVGDQIDVTVLRGAERVTLKLPMQ